MTDNVEKSNCVLDIEQIKQLLPHRYPFLLVDRVTSIKENESISAYKNITSNEPFFNGHFPSRAVMPGVLQVEALAQAAGLLILKSVDAKPGEDTIFYFAGIDGVRFKQIVTPGDCLKLDIEVIKSRRELWKFKAVATVDGNVACAGELMLIKG
jgi:3-hydroxyacyl-[acyl-carrier-protein] dehydratase